MDTCISNLAIRGIATCLPGQSYQIESFGDMFGHQEVKRIMKGTGVRKVHIAPESICASDLCEAAAKRLLKQLHIEAVDIDGVVFVSQTPDYIFPATSALLQHRLGLPASAVAFDINYGCSGYIYGLYQASILVAAGGCSRVLVLVGDTFTRLIHPGDRSMRMVMGDGAAATLVEKGSDSLYFSIGTDGSGGDHIRIKAGGSRYPRTEETSNAYTDNDGNVRNDETVHMNGFKVMSFALTQVPLTIDRVLAQASWPKDTVNLFALHQANELMIEFLRKKIKVSKDVLPSTLQETGNTGPASIPLMLSAIGDDFAEEKRKRSVPCGFGVGLSWGAVAADLSKTVILPTIYLDGSASL